MNLSNKLTVGRMLVVPLFLFALLPESFFLPRAVDPWFRFAALAIFVGAAISDYYDGMLARKHGWITSFGQLFDPLADKLIVMAAMVGMIELDMFSAWMVALILCRELLVTGFRTLAVGKGKVLAADRWGKNKTILQMTTIITALVLLFLRDVVAATGRVEPGDLDRVWQWCLAGFDVLMLACVALTVLSGAQYFAKNWDLIAEDLA